MRLPDRWSFRQRPAGAFKALLKTPVWLYRGRLGFLMGHRFLLITHLGRQSAHPRTATRLLASMGNADDGTAPERPPSRP
jgi:hypothetical protein